MDRDMSYSPDEFLEMEYEDRFYIPDNDDIDEAERQLLEDDERDHYTE
jgi:hypothetical protein